MKLPITPDSHDIAILRGLFQHKKKLAHDPIMAERRRLWIGQACLCSERPMVLAETGGVLDELVPVWSLQCKQEWARSIERGLRELIFRCEQVKDDWVVEPRITWQWDVTFGDYGVQTELVRGQNEGKLASYHWEPPIQDLDRDFDLLHFRRLSVERSESLAWRDFLEEHFGDILPIQFRASYWWTAGLTWTAINLIGLQPLMMAMYDNPSGLHRLMAFLRDDFLHMMDWFEKEELLSLNNQDDYIGSGSIGYTNELPPRGMNPGDPVRISDLWGLSESQETVGVSPKLFEEFIFPYQLPVIARFGQSYYGCCEPVHTRIHILKHLPNLRRISVSPWCDQEIMARECGNRIIFCRKPNPAMISTDIFDEDAIRHDIHQTLDFAKGCAVELVMKDVHTLNNQPERLGRWVQLAREEIDRAWS